jgi:hypothetical protein
MFQRYNIVDCNDKRVALQQVEEYRRTQRETDAAPVSTAVN